MLLYALLHLTGVKAVNAKSECLGEPSVTLDDIKRFREIGSKCPGHLEYHLTSGTVIARPLTTPSLCTRAVSLRPITPSRRFPSQCHAAIDQMGLSGDVARFIGHQDHRQRRDLLRGAEPPHRLTVDEVLPHHIDRLVR
jgi:hypothetical protein